MDVLALVAFFRSAFPYLIAGAVGFSVGWWVQEFRVEAAQNDLMTLANKFTAYRIEQDRLRVQHGLDAEKRREETIKDWSNKYAQLQKDNDIYRRCVAAGKCGGLSNVPGNSPSLKLSGTLGIDATPKGNLPATAGATADETPLVLRDCAADVLQLIQLQEDIQKQAHLVHK